LPPFQPEQALATAAKQPRAADGSASSRANFYAYLTGLRDLFQAAILRDGRLRSGVADDDARASLRLWIGPTGRLLRADAPAADSAAGRNGRAQIGRVLIDLAMNLGHVPAPPDGLPQPVEIGLDAAELRPGSLRNFLEE
jgi:hypothetical protein